MLLGIIAARTGERLLWDGQARTVTNVKSANQYLSREYRAGWEI